MKKIVYSILVTLSGLVLLFGYRTSHVEAPAAALDSASTAGTDAAAAAGSGGTGSASATASGSAAATGSGAATDTGAGASDAASASTSSGFTDGTYTGTTAGTRYGPVQVQITVAGGQITDVQVPQYPSGNSRDRQINERALPVLVSETIDAQSAEIHMVSGATYTSDGYTRSLQSALDEARA
ncbi:FMN-binding protein [Microbacterium sp. NPDC077184]|uniref:FMN-binding protein n=1 Tax=Microbacterium sp. NPDC077184 TaxID=3154764 RepID=UPI0034482AAF